MRKVLIILLIVFAAVVLGLAAYIYVVPQLNAENRQINAWISANNLNKYGDTQNTAYSNGKPICSTCSRYDYIKKMHPDKPWAK